MSKLSQAEDGSATRATLPASARARLPAGRDETVATLASELRRDLKRRPCRPGSRLAQVTITGLGVDRMVSKFAGADCPPIGVLRDALASGWDRAPWQRARYIAAAGGDRNAVLEVLGEIRDQIPTERGHYGPVAIVAPAPMARVTHVRARPARPRARSRRERRGSCRSNRAGPDDDGGSDPDPAVGDTPARRWAARHGASDERPARHRFQPSGLDLRRATSRRLRRHRDPTYTRHSDARDGRRGARRPGARPPSRRHDRGSRARRATHRSRAEAARPCA